MSFKTFFSYSQTYKYLVLKGGGIRGIAYVGAYKALEEKNIAKDIERVGGTSAGAITGALICLGYTSVEMDKVMSDLDLADFNDGEGFFIGGQRRMRKNFGWYKGNNLENWLGIQIALKTGNPNTTLLELHRMALNDKKFKDLYVTVTNLSKQQLEVFSWETQPNLPIKTAVRASAAIPLYYGAVFMDSLHRVIKKPKKGIGYDVYVDGGLKANYPITIFNAGEHIAGQNINEHTLGLKLERPEQIAYASNHIGLAPFQILSFRDYVAALYNLTIEELNKSLPHAAESKNTIYISTGNLSPKVRHISKEQKQLLYDNGSMAVYQFFDPS